MIVTFIAILLIVFLHERVVKDGEIIDEALENKYFLICCSIMVILAALRYVPWGTDMNAFVEEYKAVSKMSFRDIYWQWPSYFGYYGFSKLFAYTRLPYQFWFGLIEAFLLMGFARLINRFSEDKILALFIFFTCGIYTFSFHGLKQIVAMAFVWNAFADFYDKRFWRCVILFVCGYLSHKSALFFGLAFVLWFFKERSFFNYIIAFICAVFVLFSSAILSFLTNILEDDHYLLYIGDSSSTYNLTTFLFYFGLFVAAILSSGSKDDELIESKYSIGMAAIATFSQLFALVIASAFRLGVFFAPFLCIMTANKIKGNNIIKIVVIIVSAVFMLYSGRNSPYQFFWQ